MTAPTPGPLKQPRERSFMSANMILPIHDVLSRFISTDHRDRLFRDAGLKFLPSPQEPVRERQVAQVHQAVRRELPDDWPHIMKAAGEMAGRVVLDYRMEPAARDLLRRLPWSLATWMLVRTTTQNAWTFTGSGDFRVVKTSTLEIGNNPVTRSEVSKDPVCVFQQTVLETVFSQAIDTRLSFVETACCAAGSKACRFELAMP